MTLSAQESSLVRPAPRALLQVDRLAVRFGSAERPLDAVDGVSFTVAPGETVCLVGESGSGKTVTALSVLRLEQHKHARIIAGDVVFDGRGLVGLPASELDALRGRRVGMIFQEPMTAFDPVFTIGEQIVETILRHEAVSRSVAWERAVALLERVHLPDARIRMKQIPEELSGGMRQRAMIAMALACGPDLLIADEPTTALDVTIQAQILALLKELQREDGMAILLITHDLGVAAEMADRVVVMYAGRIVEQAPVRALFKRPAHPYTRGLLQSAVPHDSERGVKLSAIGGSIPRLDQLPRGCRFHPRCSFASDACREETPEAVVQGERMVACWHPLDAELSVVSQAKEARRLPVIELLGQPERARSAELPRALDQTPLIEARRLTKFFDTKSSWFAANKRIQALDEVSLHIDRGETLGLVGESGCGKSTLGRVLLQLEPASGGDVYFEGQRLSELRGGSYKRARREMQMIFQDPYGSIDPRWTVGDVIAEPLVAHDKLDRATLRDRVEELLTVVGLDPSARTRFAHEFSGGQRQRIGIARAIALSPKFIVADEAVSALDLSVQAQIVNLLVELRERLGLTTLFIGHGLHVVRHLSDRIGVMYLGRLVEVGPSEELFRHPAHHYTKALLASIPVADPERRRELTAPPGELPSPSSPPSGCHFHPRCPAATLRCRSEVPVLKPTETGRLVACHHPAS
jgi:peptide/nickel transport system ATP-binding protein